MCPLSVTGRPQIRHHELDLGARRRAAVLIVDDCGVSRRVIQAMLASAGFTNLWLAESGFQALDLIRQRTPDLVILDIMMPGIDGLEVCRRLRADKATHDLPILIQSAADLSIGRGKIFAAGATDIVSKPLDVHELLARCGLLLDRRILIQGLQDYRTRLQSELAAAQSMQSKLLPSAGETTWCQNNLAIESGAFVCPSSELGGDLWGLRPIDDDTLGFFNLDFSGHGIAASLNVFRIHALIHELSSLAKEPALLLPALNSRLTKLLPRGNFATMLYGVIYCAADRLAYASAGAPMPLIRASRNDTLKFADSAGLPLGIDDGAVYELHDLPFEPGGAILLYSDGLVDAQKPNGARVGDDLLLEAATLGLQASGSAQSAIDRVKDQLLHDVVLPPADDVTLICLRREESLV